MELDKDLAARQEARVLCAKAKEAQKALAGFSQEKLDSIVEAVAKAFSAAAVELAELAVGETGFGNVEDKIVKNRFASETVAEAIRGMKTVGLLREVPGKKLWEIGIPVGVIAAIVPSTNPTSTVCYKAMIALKAGSILPTVLAHFCNNTVIILAEKFGWDMGVLPVTITSAICLVAAVAFLIFDTVKAERKRATEVAKAAPDKARTKVSRKQFFLCALFGIVVCALGWIFRLVA